MCRAVLAVKSVGDLLAEDSHAAAAPLVVRVPDVLGVDVLQGEGTAVVQIPGFIERRQLALRFLLLFLGNPAGP